MKPILLLSLALPLLITGCSTYVGYDEGYYNDGYYGPGYYDGGVYTTDVAVYGYDRGDYYHHYHHYGGGERGAVASRSVSRGSTHVASASRTSSSGHVSHASRSASASSGRERF